MKAKQKRLLWEAGAAATVGLVGVSIVLPTLVSANDSVAAVVGIGLSLALLGWVASLCIRINRAFND